MSNAVRGTSGAQGSGGLAVGGGSSSSRAAPADGASFGGVLGQAMAGLAHPAPGADDGKADGKSDDKDRGKDTANTAAGSGTAAALVADLAPATSGSLAGSAAASGTGAGLTAAQATGRTGKKRPSDTAAANPGQTAQAAAAVVASLVAPAASGGAASAAAGVASAAAVGAATGAAAVSKDARIAANAPASNPATRPATSPRTITNQELVGPEDGTGSQEPDGSDPAQATVGRPAALALAGLVTALPSSAAQAAAAPSAGSASAPASGSLDQQAAVAPGAAPAAGTAASTLVLAALATSERDPNHTSPGNNGGTAPVAVAGAGSPTASPGVSIAGFPLSPALSSQPAQSGANGEINVVAPDGSSQPLGNALGSQILSMVTAGRNQVTVHISPPDLGSLTVHVEVQSRDVSAWFASPQPQVQQAVSDALAQLHGSLSGAGLNLSGAWVGADVSGGGNGRPAAAPLPVRRAAAAPGRVEPTAGGTTSVEGLSVYA